jgi:methanogenic corrinoid protein MtbC1
MVNMGEIVSNIKNEFPEAKVFIGGAPVNNEFCKKIGADFYAPDPQGVVEYLNAIAS